MTRLETLEPGLADRLQRASATTQRRAALAACDFAVGQSKIEHPLVKEVLEKLRAGNALESKERAELEALVLRLDEEYLDLQEAAENGRVTTNDYLRVFRQARAAASILSAFHDNPIQASHEAVYEAAAITDEPAQLFARIDEVLLKVVEVTQKPLA